MKTWHGSDAVMALQPSEGSVMRYIAKRTGDTWTAHNDQHPPGQSCPSSLTL